jgi:hypothetical protein
MNRWVILISIAALVVAGQAAQAFDFWGITVGSQTYDSSSQLTFSGVAESGASYVVGGYKYTQVDQTWYGPFDPASPGAGFLASRRSDAQGLFFKADQDSAKFMIITGACQNGMPATECGTGTRLFGPGDLKIDVGGQTYGIGMRLSNLLWAVDPQTTNRQYLLYSANGGTESIYARDAGTLGDVELDPRWAHAGNSAVPAGSDLASAFFVSGTGQSVGSASVSFANTGIRLDGAQVYAYEVTVPWSVLGMSAGNYDFTASWRPDCGNDLITGDFALKSGFAPVPEPGSVVTVLGGVLGALAYRKRG